MKKLIVSMLTAGLLMLSSMASAGGYKNYGHGHKHHGHYSHGYGHGYKHHGNRHHGYHHKKYRSHNKHRRKSRHRTAYALGGLILGSALTYGLTRPRYHEPRYQSHYNSRRYYQPHERHYGRYYSYPRY